MSLVDRLDVAASIVAGSTSETKVVKATRNDLEPPKEKHVRALILQTNDGAVPAADLVGGIMLRLEKPQWNVVLKTLMLSHRLLRDGNLRFINELKFRPKTFSLDRFADNESPGGVHNSAFVRKYGQYLEEKVNVFKSIKVEFEKKPNACKNLDVDDMFIKLPKLQSLINALLNCRVQRADLNNRLIRYAFQYLLKDSFALYTCLSDGIINLIERFFDMRLADAERAFAIYKLFAKETEGIISLYEMCRSFASNVPDVSAAPTQLMGAMEDQLAGLRGEHQAADGADAGKKKRKKKKRDEAKQAAQQMASAPAASTTTDFFAVDWDAAAPSTAATTTTTATTSTPTNAPGFAAFDPFSSPAPVAPVATTAAAPTMSVSPFAAAPSSSTPAFDPFSSPAAPAAPAAAAAPSQADKMARILAVQAQTAAPVLTPETSANAMGTGLVPEKKTPVVAFNPFPQQPLNQQPPPSNWAQNPFQ